MPAAADDGFSELVGRLLLEREPRAGHVSFVADEDVVVGVEFEVFAELQGFAYHFVIF